MIMVIVSAILIGGVMGLTGAGGGILAVPVLVAGMQWTMQQAAPVALIAVSCGAAVGAMDGFRHRLVRYKAAFLMALCGAPMTHWGQMVAQHLSQTVLLGVFSILMLFVAWRFFQHARQIMATDDVMRVVCVHEETGRFIWTPLTAFVLAAMGMLTGLMTGLLGVGGGFLIVPLMRRFTRLPVAGIVATSLFVITLVGSAGVVNAVLSGAQLPAVETSAFVSALVLGMVGGRKISRRLNPLQVQQGFALLLGGVAFYMLYKSSTMWAF